MFRFVNAVDDVVLLDPGLAEDGAADAVFAVLQRDETADGPAPLVADAETVAGARIVDGMTRAEMDARVRGEDEELHLRLGAHHQHGAELVVTAEVPGSAGRKEDADLRTQRALPIPAPREHASEIHADVTRPGPSGLDDGRATRARRGDAARRGVVRIAAGLDRVPGERDRERGPVEDLEACVAVDRELILDDGRPRAPERVHIGRNRARPQRTKLIADAELPEEDRALVGDRPEEHHAVVGRAGHLETIEVEGLLLSRSCLGAQRRSGAEQERGAPGRSPRPPAREIRRSTTYA